ncbi:uncharacterized protein ACNLHF_010483 [Anomaloglossus baeobatrachus]|uniref:uncharacterized protein LOC142283317 n=1 Tax=Anomaloglossus baeobatrachus TaxID=238106 RepID=UPI003F503982
MLGAVVLHEQMMQDTERGSSAWSYSKTELCEEDTLNLLKEFAEQKRKERENDPEVKRIKNKYSLRAPTYPSPGNILHTGRQLPRTPGPGVLPLLPSQKFEPRADEAEESLTSYGAERPDNMVPCGRQLPRTPTKGNVLREIQVNVKEGECIRSQNRSQRDGNSSMICDAGEGERTRSNSNVRVSRVSNKILNMETMRKDSIDEDIEVSGHLIVPNNRRISEMPVQGINRMRISGVLKKMAGYECRNEDLEFLKHVQNQEKAKVLKDSIDEDIEVSGHLIVPNNRRISEMPVQGINRMRISGVLKKMAGYECRNEDLEFLKHVQNQEKAKVLKKELLRLRKDFTTANQEKEMVLAKKEKIEDDIEKMKMSFDQMVQLGRALLSRTQDPTHVGSLAPDDVLKQLNPETIQHVHQQTRLQLAEAEKQLAKWEQEAANRASVDENQRRSFALKVESTEQQVQEVQCRIQQLKEEVIFLKTQIKRVEENQSELQATVQIKRQQISDCLKTAKQGSEMSEEEREKMKRKLQRILHRKDNYLERQRILQRLKENIE